MNKGPFSRLLPDDKTYTPFLWLMIAAFSVDSILRYVVIVLRKLPIVSMVADAFLPALFMVLIFINFKSAITKHIRMVNVLAVVMFWLVLLISYIMYPDTRPYMHTWQNTFVITMPLWFFLGLTFTADEKTLNMLALLGKVIWLVDIAFTVFSSSGGRELNEDAMSRAYRLLPSVLVLMSQAFNKVTTWNIVWCVGSAFWLLTCGTRGPLLVTISFLLYCVLFKRSTSGWKRVLSIVILLVAVGFFFSDFFDTALEWLIKLFDGWGVSTRILRYMEEGMIADSSGRDTIFKQVFELIKRSPLGYGVMGEYPFLNWNTHNFYLQLIMHYGVVLGGLAILAVLRLVWRAWRNNPNPYACDFIAMWALTVLLRGFFGGSYLSYYFCFMLGLCIREIRNQKDVYPALLKKEEA